MKTNDSKFIIPQDKFLSIAMQIQNATSFDELFKEVAANLGLKRISYHHLVDIGEFRAGERKRYFSYNLPEAIIGFLENQHDLHADAGVVRVFSTGHYVWLSDMLDDPIVLKKGDDANIRGLIKAIGDGLLVPLYGPQNRRGYLYLGFGEDKSIFAPGFPWQIQSLAQIAHVKYTLMLLSLKTKINLTNREIEVLELMTFGKTNPEIGIILNISTNTVSGYVKQIFLKLGTADRVTAALRARSLSEFF